MENERFYRLEEQVQELNIRLTNLEGKVSEDDEEQKTWDEPAPEDEEWREAVRSDISGHVRRKDYLRLGFSQKSAWEALFKAMDHIDELERENEELHDRVSTYRENRQKHMQMLSEMDGKINELKEERDELRERFEQLEEYFEKEWDNLAS